MSDHVSSEVLASLTRIEASVNILNSEVSSLGTRIGHIEAEWEHLRAFVAERHSEVIGNIRRSEAKADRIELGLDRVRDDVSDVTLRLGYVDSQIASWAGNLAVQGGRQNRFEARLEFIETRLELRDDPPAP